jgi:hypothetical protein
MPTDSRGGWTPGEWYEGTEMRIISADGTIVCTVSGASLSDSARADARLISAAPDMAAALSVCLQALEVASDWNLDEIEINGQMRTTIEIIKQVKAALAKAGAPNA